ncbi:MAG: hypothetical protein QM845_11070 [Verrucomicrobiota bacterium]|jgi:hypothetical protein|nr:hypothetical protein [Verrucomicrobiota bacterium]NMD21216.1 hypothetical protein [Verrucomicrobiota bacterium]
MREQKLANALAFLSMDCLSQFAEKLWIAPPLADWRLNGLRDHIRDSLRGEQFHDRYPELCWRLYHSNETQGMKAWSQLWNWVDSVFLYGGEDRSPERIWSLVLAEHWAQSRDAGDLLAGLSHRLNAIQDSVASARKEAAPLLANLATSPLTEWDAIILPQIHLEPDFLTDKLDLMLGYNELVKSWRKEARFEIQELCEIHEWGKKRAAKFGLREIDMPFPGCWEYGLFGA